MKAQTLKRFALTVGAVLSLSACGMFSNDSRYEPVDLTEYTATVQPGVIWSSAIGSGSGYGFAPALSANSVFAATPDGSVVRLNAATGATEWRVKLDKELAGGVGVGEGLVAVTTRDGFVIVLDEANGQKRWESRTSTIARTPPVVGNGVVIVRADDFRVQAYKVADGSLSWSYVRTNPDLSLKTNTRMLLVDAQTVLVAVPTGRLVAINTSNGRVMQEMFSAVAKGPMDLDSVTDVVGQPVVYGNDICFASYQGNVVCYQITHQGLVRRWSQPFSTSVGVDGTANAVIGAAIDGTVEVFARQDGSVVWKDQTLKNRGLTNPVVFNNHVVVADYEGYAHFYDFNTGKLEGRVSLGDSDPVVSPLLVTSVGVIAQTGDGKLVLFGVK
ncbi:outer membrane protein assembly factor BamB [Pelistega europaea]|uniref:Outer membrane protein assembly factor BamB n=1 Tax=Pelistega europaea TaxID=106147 RepID=A0A7Y4L9T8_9BURK|nr:outer membrane protein assembly factor BamB [Pelistega europaea]NOL49610.1 outer membrane protein assembly factor BamB [Pelistega europaea]